MYVYLATDLSEVGAQPHGAEEEEAVIVRVPTDEIAALVLSGDVVDAKTLVALGLYLIGRE